ncbi:hypothetical protein GCM10027066_19070 [Dyella jejuensis]
MALVLHAAGNDIERAIDMSLMASSIGREDGPGIAEQQSIHLPEHGRIGNYRAQGAGAGQQA